METLLFTRSPPLNQFQLFQERPSNSRVPVLLCIHDRVSDPRLKPLLVVLQVTVDFDRQEFHKMCWTLCSRKKLNQSKLMISNDDAFKVWCIFNFLSDDQYPLVIITEEVSDEQQH